MVVDNLKTIFCWVYTIYKSSNDKLFRMIVPTLTSWEMIIILCVCVWVCMCVHVCVHMFVCAVASPGQAVNVGLWVHKFPHNMQSVYKSPMAV